MKNRRLNKFNLICEQQQINLIYEANKKGLQLFLSKRWSLEEEFECMLEFIKRKVETAFTNIYDNQPGELQLRGDPDITEINQGTQEPGYKVEYNIDDDYIKNNLFPYLKQINYFIELNERFHFFDQQEPYDAKLILKVYANSEKYDLSKSNIQIPKFGIEKWSGDIYFNFKCVGVDRNKSSINVGDISIKVEVKEYKGLIEKFLDVLNGISRDHVEDEGLNKTLGDGLFNIFGTKKKKNKGQWDRIETQKGLLGGKVPGANIKCIVTLDKTKTKVQDTLDRDYNSYLGISRLERANKNNTSKQYKQKQYKDGTICYERIFDWNLIMDIFNDDNEKFYQNIKNQGHNITINPDAFIIDSEDWTTAEKHDRFYEAGNDSVDDNYIKDFKPGHTNEYICLWYNPIDVKDSNNKLIMRYQVFLNITKFIEEYNKSNIENGNLLFAQVIDAPMLKIQVCEKDTGDVLFERYYTRTNFQKYERDLYIRTANFLNTVKLKK